MSEEDLFHGLPLPSATFRPPYSEKSQSPTERHSATPHVSQSPPLKSALKRHKPPETQVLQKHLRFKTTTDVQEAQVIEAMKKIAFHIRNPSKFSKASKLAIQLIQAGSVNAETSDYFFAILDAAMIAPFASMDSSHRADYHNLFSAAQDIADCLTKPQKNQLATWTIKAVVANELYTDDSFVFSKAAGRIKEAISHLPETTEEDDKDEATVLSKYEGVTLVSNNPSLSSAPSDKVIEHLDPFGLDVLLPVISKKDETLSGKLNAAYLNKEAAEGEGMQFLRERRESIMLCLEIAAIRYKLPWAQTVIDILVKHAFDNSGRFTSQQRNAIQKIWVSVREQQVRRKQGKSAPSKLDMNAFEWLQEKYANEKISIRHAVGGDGDRKAEQWLG